MNAELVRVMSYLDVLFWCLPVETDKIIEKLDIVGNLSGIRTRHLQNTIIFKLHIELKKLNSVALVRERSIPT
jgi:hypothetical protein